MKLDTKRTILIGFAFLAISAFWQMYDNIIPLILKYFFNIGDTLSGGIMALDNIFALFMLPIFGALSDKVSTNKGKRTPFIFVGTILSVIFMIIIYLKVRRNPELAPAGPRYGAKDRIVALSKLLPVIFLDDRGASFALFTKVCNLKPVPLL